MYKGVTLTINKDYRITIPKQVREFFRMRPGDFIQWEVTENGLVVISKAADETPPPFLFG